MLGMPVPTLDIDPFEEALLHGRVDAHAAIRDAGTVVWIPSREIWMTGRDSVVREVLTDPARFSSAYGVGLVNIRREGSWQKPSVILEVDPPDHEVTRRVFNRILAPKAVGRLREHFETTAARLVDELLEQRDDGVVDLAADLAFRFPFTVLPDVVGLRSDGREHLMRYSAMYFNNRVPGSRLAEASMAAGEASLGWVREACRREHIAEGGFGASIYESVDDGSIDADTAASLVRTFLGGGIDTTVLVLGSMFDEFARRPEQWALFRSDRSLARAAFDEGLRLAPGAPVVGRTTAAPTELAGVELAAEQKIVCSLVAANRDPARWERPDEFDITRGSTGHLGFGLGPHFCSGHAVARLEAECVLNALADRVVSLEPAGEPTPVLNNWLHGIEHLPVRLTSA